MGLDIVVRGRGIYEGVERKTVVAARKAKRRLENPLTKAQKAKKVVAEAERQRKIQRTADEKCERLRAKAKDDALRG